MSLHKDNDDRDHAIQSFASDDDVCEAMYVLAGRGDDDIVVQLDSVDNRIFVCGSENCKRVLVRRTREDNAICKACSQKKWRERIVNEKREINYDKMTASDSHTRFDCLPPDMQSKRALQVER